MTGFVALKGFYDKGFRKIVKEWFHDDSEGLKASELEMGFFFFARIVASPPGESHNGS